MKILILTSSFRKNGNTSRILDLLITSIRHNASQFALPVDLATIHLADTGLTHCHGCRVCFDRGETHCPYWDEIAPVKAAMQEADVWILASPVYVEDVNGVMKIFLERMAHVNHRPEFAGKYACLLTTSGAGSSGHASGTMANTLRTWGVQVTGQRDFVCGALSTPGDLKTRYEKRLSGIGRKIVSAYRKETALSPSFVSLIFFKVQQHLWTKHVDDSIDYHYWESKGWLKPGVTYYFSHRANPLTVFFARLTGSVIARFFE